MFNGHFYHAITRNSVAVFGTLFNDITVARKDSAGTFKDVQKVPLAYGPRQKFLSRIEEQTDLTDPRVALKLPRMSFEITNMMYDSQSAQLQGNRIKIQDDNGMRTSVGTPAPYILDMQLNILAKNQDDALQILEQIIPFFRPTYTVSVKYVEGVPSVDVPITLQNVSVLDDYEGDFTSRRVLVYTIDFTMKVKYFGAPTSAAIINKSSVDVNDLVTSNFMEEITAIPGSVGVDNTDDNDITT